MKGRFSFLMLLCFCSLLSFAGPIPPGKAFHRPSLTTPISLTVSNKKTVLFLPNSCSGLIQDYVAGDGKVDIAVQGKIQNGQLSVQIKVDYKGTVVTTVGNITYNINGNMSASETRAIQSEPIDIFIKGLFKMVGKNKSSNLFLSDLGYITVYPDGSVIDHILDPNSDPAYSHPKIYCSNPAGN